MDGGEGEASRRMRIFASRLHGALESTGAEVFLWDERLSTSEAEEILRERGVDWRGRKKVVDRVAAAVILQEYLDDLAGGGGGTAERVDA
jgi:putative Holliday junction resolvase